MSTDKGYIKLYRDIRDHWVWKEKPFDRAHAWIDLIMMMNHEDKKTLFDGNLITVRRGSVITSLRQLSVRWGWSKDKVSHFLDVLEKDGMIRQKRDTKKTALSLVNYGVYQNRQDSSRDSKKTLIGRRSDTDRNKQETIEDTKKKEEEKAPPVSDPNTLTAEEIAEGWRL